MPLRGGNESVHGVGRQAQVVEQQEQNNQLSKTWRLHGCHVFKGMESKPGVEGEGRAGVEVGWQWTSIEKYN